MEKQTIETSKNNETLILDKRKSIKISGIAEILNSSETNIVAKLKDTNLLISGNNIHITKLDINIGLLEADGDFLCIKYGKQSNIFRKIFK